MLRQGLPFLLLWQPIALVVFSSVREEFHARFLTMFPPGLDIFITRSKKC